MTAKSLILPALAAALAAIVPRPAAAQAYPSHPITMVVPFPAGGPTDALGRIVAERMRPTLGQSVIVENVSGAGGTIAIARVARAAADGYTIIIGNVTSHVLSGAAYTTTYNLLEDFEPVALISTSALWLIGRNTLPANNLAELITWLRANPGKASFATIGVGSPGQVWGIYFQDTTNTRFQLVPYRGAAPVVQDLLAGLIDFTTLEASSTLPYVREGKIKAFIVLSKTRWNVAPEVPATEEAGVPGLEMPYWNGLWVRKGTPDDIIARLNAAVVEAMSDPALRARLVEIGQGVPAREQQTPQALGAIHRAEIAKWWPIAKAANTRVE